MGVKLNPFTGQLDLTGGSSASTVTNPSLTSTDKAVARFSGTTGTQIQNSSATLDDAGNLTATSFIGDGTSLTGVEKTANKAQANGYASLDGGGKVPLSQLPSTLMEFKGSWNPNTNSPALADGSGTSGFTYWVSAARAAAVTGLNDASMANFQIGDLVIYNGTAWVLVTPAAGVQSVNGFQGAVTVNAINQLTGDVTAGPASGSASAASSVAKIQGTTVSGTTGTGNVVFSVAPTLTGTTTVGNLIDSGLTASTVPYADASKQLTSSAVTPTELGYMSGVTSAIQTQLNGKASATLTSAHILVGNGSNVATDVAMTGDIAITNAGVTSYSGTVPVTKGGTGTTTQFTQGSVAFAGASGVYTQDNANFFYDATNHRLGLGTATPGVTLDIKGNATDTQPMIKLTASNGNGPTTIFTTTAGYGYIQNNGKNILNTDAAGHVGLLAGAANGPANLDSLIITNQTSEFTHNTFAIQGISSQSGKLLQCYSTGSTSVASIDVTGLGTFANVIDNGLTANTALVANASKQLTSSATTDTELGYVHGVTSAIQTQLNNKLAKSAGDIDETSFTAADNQSSAANVTGLAFANATVRGFEAWVTVVRSSTYAQFVLNGVQGAASWYLSQTRLGDDVGLTFTITTAGQIQYTSTSTGNTATVKFRALTTSV